MGNHISVIMTNAILNTPTVPSYSESSSKVQYSSGEEIKSSSCSCTYHDDTWRGRK